MDVVGLLVGIIILISIPLLIVLYLISDVAEKYGDEMQKRVKSKDIRFGRNFGPKNTLRFIIVAYTGMTIFGIWSIFQGDRLLLIFGITIQAFAFVMAMTALVFSVIIMNIWKRKINGEPVSNWPPGL